MFFNGRPLTTNWMKSIRIPTSGTILEREKFDVVSAVSISKRTTEF